MRIVLLKTSCKHGFSSDSSSIKQIQKFSPTMEKTSNFLGLGYFFMVMNFFPNGFFFDDLYLLTGSRRNRLKMHAF